LGRHALIAAEGKLNMTSRLTLPDVGGFITTFIRRNKADVATRPVIEGGTRHPYGPFQFQFSLTDRCPYDIEASSDLKHWKTISSGTFSGENGEKMDYVDSEAPRYTYRFYRVLCGALQSTTIIGFASVSIAPRFSMIGNPFDSVSKSIVSILPQLPDGASVSKFDTAQSRLTKNLLEDARWTRPHETLNPGEGAIIFNPSDEFKVINFVGRVMHGNLLNPIPAGFSIRSSLLPLPGRLDTDLEFPISEGDCVHLFDRDRQEYVVYEYPSKQWERNPPVVGVGEAFWVGKNSPGNWARKFQVN
jgi:hypothetical protein